MTRRIVAAAAMVVGTAGILVGVFGGLLGADSAWPLAWIAWAPVGYLIVVRRTGNLVGVALLLVGFSWGLAFFLAELAARLPAGPVAAWAELLGALAGVVPWIAIIWVVLVFPTGTYPRRSELVMGSGLIAYGMIVLLAFSFRVEAMEYTGLASPLASTRLSGVWTFIAGDSGLSGFHIMLVFAVFALALLVDRWRHSEGTERRQFQWLMYGAATFVFVTAASQVLPEGGPGDYVWLLAGWAIPISIGVAVLRYRLYDIERVVSRTVGFAVVVSVLAFVYASGAIWLPAAVMGEEAAPPYVAGTTLAAAALFSPLRRRIMLVVDRRFYRSRYDAEMVADSFSTRLRGSSDARIVVDEWVGAVSVTVQPSMVGLWVRST